jgi:hypothetical protein
MMDDELTSFRYEKWDNYDIPTRDTITYRCKFTYNNQNGIMLFYFSSNLLSDNGDIHPDMNNAMINAMKESCLEWAQENDGQPA